MLESTNTALSSLKYYISMKCILITYNLAYPLPPLPAPLPAPPPPPLPYADFTGLGLMYDMIDAFYALT